MTLILFLSSSNYCSCVKSKAVVSIKIIFSFPLFGKKRKNLYSRCELYIDNIIATRYIARYVKYHTIVSRRTRLRQPFDTDYVLLLLIWREKEQDL